MKTITLWREGESIIVETGSGKEKSLRKSGWSDRKPGAPSVEAGKENDAPSAPARTGPIRQPKPSADETSRQDAGKP